MARTHLGALFRAIALPLSASAAQQGTALAAGSARVIYNLANRQNDNEIIALINAAKTRVYFVMYIFTLPDIANALVAAKKRGAAGLTAEWLIRQHRTAALPHAT